jgi:hypothetical protein
MNLPCFLSRLLWSEVFGSRDDGLKRLNEHQRDSLPWWSNDNKVLVWGESLFSYYVSLQIPVKIKERLFLMPFLICFSKTLRQKPQHCSLSVLRHFSRWLEYSFCSVKEALLRVWHNWFSLEYRRSNREAGDVVWMLWEDSMMEIPSGVQTCVCHSLSFHCRHDSNEWKRLYHFSFPKSSDW